jgi:hypothetical protein
VNQATFESSTTQPRWRRPVLAGVLFGASVALVISLFYIYTPKPTVSYLMRSGGHSLVAADNLEVRLGTPRLSGYVHDLNTIVLTNPKILSHGTQEMVPSGALYVVVSQGDRLAQDTASAITAHREDDATLGAQGITPHGEGIPYLAMFPAPVVDIYKLNRDGTLTWQQRVTASYLLVKYRGALSAPPHERDPN